MTKLSELNKDAFADYEFQSCIASSTTANGRSKNIIAYANPHDGIIRYSVRVADDSGRGVRRTESLDRAIEVYNEL